MRLCIDFPKFNAGQQEKERLCLVFRNAMLDYCPSVEKLEYYSRKNPFKFKTATYLGARAVREYTNEQFAPVITFEQ